MISLVGCPVEKKENTVSENNGQESGDEGDVRQILNVRLLAAMKAELGAEENQRAALRKALLFLILTTQDSADEAGRDVIDYLLKDFSPLADRFRKNLHSFCNGHPVARGQSKEEDHLILGLPKDLVNELLRFPKDT